MLSPGGERHALHVLRDAGGVVSDMHPDYLSTGFAQSAGFPLITVQHHHAHVASCMAENGLRGTVLGISWDGTGYGTDGTIWGGEFLLTDGASFERVAALRSSPCRGGEKAIRNPAGRPSGSSSRCSARDLPAA